MLYPISRRILLGILVSTGVTGCHSLPSDGLIMSSAPADLTPEASNAIAGDMVGRLVQHLSPAKETIRLKQDGSAFGQALQTSLKASGYAVITEQNIGEEHVVDLAYVIDTLDGAVLARLSTKDLDLGRSYKVTSSGATPASPFAVSAHGQGGL